MRAIGVWVLAAVAALAGAAHAAEDPDVLGVAADDAAGAAGVVADAADVATAAAAGFGDEPDVLLTSSKGVRWRNKHVWRNRVVIKWVPRVTHRTKYRTHVKNRVVYRPKTVWRTRWVTRNRPITTVKHVTKTQRRIVPRPYTRPYVVKRPVIRIKNRYINGRPCVWCKSSRTVAIFFLFLFFFLFSLFFFFSFCHSFGC
jgi:hypothetical protein